MIILFYIFKRGFNYDFKDENVGFELKGSGEIQIILNKVPMSKKKIKFK